MELIVESLDGLKDAVKALLEFAGGRKKMTFSGEIGAGKTTFIKMFCQYFEVTQEVVSPTFSLINEYTFTDRKNNTKQLIHHIDLYRLKNLDEAIDIGIEDYLYDDHYCLIEWPEIINPILPEQHVKINFEILDNSSRKIIFL